MRHQAFSFLWSHAFLLASCLPAITLMTAGFLLLAVLYPKSCHGETTLYFGSVEKNLTTGDRKLYLPAGNSSVLKQCANAQCANALISYLHSDHLGSTVLTTDASGVKTSSLAYYPFGNSKEPVNPQPANPLTDKLYTSQRLDPSNNLYYYNARYYNPKTSHFLSADKAEGPNRYGYVGNNPVMKNDPSGNCSGKNCWLQDKYNDLSNRVNHKFQYNNQFVGDLAQAMATGKGNADMAVYYNDTAKYLAKVTGILINNPDELKLGARGLYDLKGKSERDAFVFASANDPDTTSLRAMLNLTGNKTNTAENSWTVGDFFGYREYFGMKNNTISSLTPAMLISLAVAENANGLNEKSAPVLAKQYGNIYNAHVGGQYSIFAAIFNHNIYNLRPETREANEVMFTLRAYMLNFKEDDIPIIKNGSFNSELFKYWRGATDDSQSIADRADLIYGQLQAISSKYPELNTELLK